MRQDAATTSEDSTSAAKNLTSTRTVRRIVYCGGVRAVLAESASGWVLDNEHDVRALTERSGTEWVLARFQALAATLDAGVVAVSDLGRLNKRLDAISTTSRDAARYVRAPDELLPAVAYACACLSSRNGSEWLAWALTGRLDSNVFKGWPLESARMPSDPSPPRVAAGCLAFVARGDTDDNFLDALPAGFWERLRTHGDPRLRSVAVASDPLTGPDALKDPAESDDAAVLRCVASHPNTPAEVLGRMAEDHSIAEETRCAMARNLKASPTLLQTLANDPSEDVRSVAAAHPTTPVPVLAPLLGDPSIYVRAAVALHPATPEHLLIAVVRHDNLFVLRHAAANPSLPPLAVELMLGDSSRWVRADAVRHPNTPVELAVGMATDRSLEVRRMVAYKPGVPAEVLEQLARDPKAQVRAAAAWNANTPAATLEALAADEEQVVRSAVAARPDAVEEILAAPADDIDDDARDDTAAGADAASSGNRRLTFLAQPPGEGVSRSEWARAFLEAQSPNPTVRQRGRDALTAMGCQWVDPAESPSAPAN